MPARRKQSPKKPRQTAQGETIAKPLNSLAPVPVMRFKNDERTEQNFPLPVTPAKAGAHTIARKQPMDPGLRRDDDAVDIWFSMTPRGGS